MDLDTPERNGMLIRDAATVVVLRGTSVLMGQRGSRAAFMPSKYVFPGGAVDAGDHAGGLQTDVAATLSQGDCSAEALAGAALRELEEETGQKLNDARALRFIFRAITPPARPRRFDARFFLVPAEDLITDPDDFSSAEDELSHLHWVPLDEARSLDVPFITEVVLAEVAAHMRGERLNAAVPFFDNSGEASVFRWITP